MKVVAIVGPTGVGKSSLGVFLAHNVGGEVISADSRQVYRGLDIGSEVMPEAERCGVPHHLIGIVDPSTVYSTKHFVTDAAQSMASVRARGHLPFIVGGTGLYISALLDGVVLPEVPPDHAFRTEAEQRSLDELVEELRIQDPRRFDTVDRKNKRRVIRALEIVRALGRVPEPHRESLYDVCWLGILPPDNLLEALEERARAQIDRGLLEETRDLLSRVPHRIDEFGFEYQAARDVLNGKESVTTLPALLARRNRAYAKRQMTYFKKNSRIVWLHRHEEEKAQTLVREHLERV